MVEVRSDVARERAVLRMFADLAADADPRTSAAVDPRTVAWLSGQPHAAFVDPARPVLLGDDERVAAVLKAARLRPDEAPLRVGLFWAARRRTGLFPLVSVPVRRATRRSGRRGLQVERDGEPELWDPTLPDEVREHWLDALRAHGWFADTWFAHASTSVLRGRTDLAAVALGMAAEAGLEGATLGRIDRSPEEAATVVEPVVVAAAALYLDAPPPVTISAARTFTAWADRDVGASAFAALYTPAPADQPAAVPEHLNPFVLDAAQTRALDASRTGDRITVISGPPGTGKSHTVVAIAADAIARGERVLVAAPSDAAVRALAALMARVRGLDPIVVGGGDHDRAALADRLVHAGADAASDGMLRARRAEMDAATRSYRAMRRDVEDQLAAEAIAGGVAPATDLVAREVAPGLFDVDVDHAAVDRVLERAAARGGWWTRRRARRAARQVRAIARSTPSASVESLRDALAAARRARTAVTLEAAGGLTLDGRWPPLLRAEDTARAASGAWLAASASHDVRRRRGGSDAMSAVAAALRSGRARRRRLLAALPGDTLTTALPLWVATLADVEDLLPPTPGMFDVVIVDEAAQVDQPSAAVALARARRAVVVGDPRQLRHVSFLADDRVAEARRANGLDADPLLAARLDLRRMTLFGVAAGAGRVHLLDVHHRSAPHLIAFSARHFYEGRLRVATTHPRNERADRIATIDIAGTRQGGVNPAEVAWIVDRLRADLDRGARSIGVVTPFRDQADAIEQAVLAALTLDDLERLDLRIGTVHGFQGCERDHVIVSLTASDRADLGFVNDPHLFNVMVTRARREMTLLTSLDGQATGLTAELLAHAEQAGHRPHPERAPDGWTGEVAAELARVGIPVVAHYPVGIGAIDLVVGAGAQAFGVECVVDDDGAAAHVDEHLALVRGGWVVRDFYATRWRHRLAEATVRLATSVRPP